MKTLLIGFSAALIGAALIVGDADAARVGGSRSVGTQRSATSTPPSSAPARQSQQVQQAAPSQQPAAAPGAKPGDAKAAAGGDAKGAAAAAPAKKEGGKK